MRSFLAARIGRALSPLLLVAVLGGCQVSIYGSTTTQGGKPSASTDKPKPEKPKPEKPKPEKPKPEKPKPEKPKPEKPKPEKPKPEKPKPEKPKPEKPKDPGQGSGESPKPPKPDPKDPPKDSDEPSKPPTKDPLPPGVSRINVPIRAPFEQLVEHVDALLPKSQSQDYRRVTKEGADAVLEVKYKAWRDPIDAKFAGRKLTIVVPVRYAANIRGKVKNPLGSDYFPLSEGQTWGTKSSPQRLRVTVSIELEVDDNWRLKSDVQLERIEHGSVPSGNFCANVGIEVCTPKKNFADEVRKQIEKQLIPQIEKELARADREIEKSLDVRGHVQELWAGLQRPLVLQKAGQAKCPTVPGGACSQAAWLLFQPTSLGLSELSLVEGDLGVEVGLEGKLSVAVGKKPKVKIEPLPKPAKPESGTAFQLRAVLDVPVKIVAEELRKALSGSDLVDGKKLALRRLDLRVQRDKSVTLSLQTAGAHEGTLEVSGQLSFDERRGEIGLDRLAFDADTRKLLERELGEKEVKALLAKVEAASQIALGKESKGLRSAVTRALDGALPGALEVKGTLGDFSFVGLDVRDDTLLVQVELEGTLGLEYKL